MKAPPLGAPIKRDENNENSFLIFLGSSVQGKVAGEERNLKIPSDLLTRDTFVQYKHESNLLTTEHFPP